MEGGCLCGSVRYTVEGPPRRVTHCHCLHCRRASGAPFVTWAEFDPATFRFVRGMPSEFSSRPRVTRKFCGRCGTQLTYEHSEHEDEIDVTAASLDTPEAVEPEDHVWCDRMLPWVRLSDGLPRFALSRYSEE